MDDRPDRVKHHQILAASGFFIFLIWALGNSQSLAQSDHRANRPIAGAGSAIHVAPAEKQRLERLERARRLRLEKTHKRSSATQHHTARTSVGAAQGNDEIARIKAALAAMPALKALKLVDIKKGPNGYGAALGTKALAIAIFPEGQQHKSGVSSVRGSAPGQQICPAVAAILVVSMVPHDERKYVWG